MLVVVVVGGGVGAAELNGRKGNCVLCVFVCLCVWRMLVCARVSPCFVEIFRLGKYVVMSCVSIFLCVFIIVCVCVCVCRVVPCVRVCVHACGTLTLVPQW
jgi:hypothetical protein